MWTYLQLSKAGMASYCKPRLRVPQKTEPKRISQLIRQERKQSDVKLMEQVKNEVADVSNSNLVQFRYKLLKCGWTEGQHLGPAPPPEISSKNLSKAESSTLSSYYQHQYHLFSKKKEAQFLYVQKKLSRERKTRREARRLAVRAKPLRKAPCLSGSGVEDVTKSLNEFRDQVHASLPDAGREMNEGWPPAGAVFIGRLKPYNREMYMFNRRLKDGRKREPVLVICNKDTPVLFLRKKEVEKLQEVIPLLATHGAELTKKQDSNILKTSSVEKI